ncbi:MAG: CARDB domain-containing protein [Balneolaceae bacterium]
MSNRPFILLLSVFVITSGIGISGCNSTTETQSEKNLNLRASPVSYHLSFDNMDFLEEEFIDLSGRRSLDEREISFPAGKFGNALHMNFYPDPPDASNMTGIDLDLVTAAMFNSRPDNQMGYTQPMLWGTGRIDPRLGAVAFWARGDMAYHGLLFEQTSVAFGRTERDLLGVFIDEDHHLSAYLRDARYERHEVRSEATWDGSDWNHVVLNWDWANGMELWLNGEVVASSWGEGGWFETAPPGLFHLPAPGIEYDELYLTDRPLSQGEIDDLMTENAPPGEESVLYTREEYDAGRLARISGGARGENLPVISPEQALSMSEVWPEYVGDGHIPGWPLIDGRNEMAWPHPYALFTVIPGDADFHAEKVDIRPPADVGVNYITLTGNLDNVRVLSGSGGMENTEELFSVPADHGFLYGQTIPARKGATFRIPFTEEFGSPSGYSFDGAQYRIPYNEEFGSPEEFSGDVHLPLSGEKRIQNIGLYHYATSPFSEYRPEGDAYSLSLAGDLTLDRRDQFQLHAVTSRDERTFALASANSDNSDNGEPETVDIGAFSRLNILSEPYDEESGIAEITLSLPVNTLDPEETLFVRVHDPALPLRLWNEFAVKLAGFDQGFQQLVLTIDFQDMVLAEGDRLWVDVGTAGRTEIKLGEDADPAEIFISPADSWQSVDAYADKQMTAASAQYSKMYGYMPWKFDGRTVSLEDPYALGGPFDMLMPALAVQRVHPDHFLANFMLKMSGPEFSGGQPVNSESRDRITLSNPHDAPEWAVYMRDFNKKRQSIIEWWKQNQNPDGQIGGGWNDDTLFMISGLKDLLYDSPGTARSLHDNIHTGLEATGLFRDGYPNIHPMDRMHNADFISERYHTVIHNLGQPHAAEREMESAWRLDKPEETPVNYSEGIPYQSSVNVFNWYWGTEMPEEPYESESLDTVTEELRLYTSLLDEYYFYGLTGSRTHTTSQGPEGSRNMFSYMLGGSYGPRWDAQPDLAVAWPSGGGPEVSRVVLGADDRSLEVAAYSFDDRLRDLQMRLMRLEDGRYRIALHEDPEGTGRAGDLLWSQEKDLARFDTISLPLPPRKSLVIRVEQLERYERPAELPDLAINPWGAVYRENSVTATVHNLGNGSAENIPVRLYDGETVVGEEIIDRLDAPVDFVARRTRVTFDDVPGSGDFRVVIDPENEIREILTGNNSARTGTGQKSDPAVAFDSNTQGPALRFRSAQDTAGRVD